MGSGPALCDGCNARITFVNVTKKAGGRARMVLNHQPDPEGNVAVRISGQSKIGRVITKGQTPDSDEVLFMPHHATCPKADRFRRRKPVTTAPAAPAPAPAPKPVTLFDS